MCKRLSEGDSLFVNKAFWEIEVFDGFCYIRTLIASIN